MNKTVFVELTEKELDLIILTLNLHETKQIDEGKDSTLTNETMHKMNDIYEEKYIL